MTTELVSAAEPVNPLAHLPEALQKKILAASAKIQQSANVSINKIRLDAKTYIFPDSTEVSSFSAIIVGVKHANIHYAGEYEEGVTNPPDCLAVGDESCANLIPLSEVESKYSVTCNDCPKMQWGSALKGKGKACGEHTLLALFVPSLGEDLFLIEEKKANSKAVDGYLANVNNKYGHPVAVLTEFTIGAKNKWEQTFFASGVVSSDLVMKLVERFEEANTMLEARVTDSYRKTPTKTEPASEVAARPARAR
jgi:hypothetical protein